MMNHRPALVSVPNVSHRSIAQEEEWRFTGSAFKAEPVKTVHREGAPRGASLQCKHHERNLRTRDNAHDHGRSTPGRNPVEA